MTNDDALVHPDDERAPNPVWNTATAQLRLAEIGVAGALAAVLIVLVWLGPRADLASASSRPFFWLKAVYTGGLAWAALSATKSIVRSLVLGWTVITIALALIFAMLIAAGVQFNRLDPAILAELFMPACVGPCLLQISGLAAPMLVFAVLGLRPLELELPALTGLAAGLFCGGVAATVYGLHCAESTFVFVGFWYTTAIVLCGAIGAGGLKLLSVSSRRRKP